MLGVRLGAEVERRLDRFARRRGRPKSDVARAAIVEYMDRHDLEEEFERQLKAAASDEASRPEARQELDEAERLAWRTINKL